MLPHQCACARFPFSSTFLSGRIQRQFKHARVRVIIRALISRASILTKAGNPCDDIVCETIKINDENETAVSSFFFPRFARTSNERVQQFAERREADVVHVAWQRTHNDRCHSRATNLTNKNVRTNGSWSHERLSYRGREQKGGKVERSEQEEREGRELRDYELQKASARIIKEFGVKRRGWGVGRRRRRETTRKGNAYFYSAGEFTIQVQKIQ